MSGSGERFQVWHRGLAWTERYERAEPIERADIEQCSTVVRDVVIERLRQRCQLKHFQGCVPPCRPWRVEPHLSPWSPPGGERLDASPVTGGDQRPRKLVLAALLVVVAGLAGLVAVTKSRSGPSDFDRRREQATALAVEAASLERSDVGTSPSGYAWEVIAADLSSGRIMLDRWQGDGEPDDSGPPILAFVYDESSAHIQSHRFDDPSRSEPTWYLMEDNDGMDPTVLATYFEATWEVLDDFTDASPKHVGLERLRDEDLERFDLFVPASAYRDGLNVTIGTVGMIDPRNGVNHSFWFTNDGELRRTLVSTEADGETWTFESWSYLSRDPIVIDLPDPDIVQSWSEYTAENPE